MILTPNIITIEIIDTIFVVLTTYIFFVSIQILRYWDKNSFSTRQYQLQMKSYLAATVVRFIFYVKIPLFLFFIYTLDHLAVLLPGAMCGAGVVNATIYGTPLLFVKILNLYLFAFWLVLDKEDRLSKEQKYTKVKFILYCIAFGTFISEMLLEFSMFSSIDIQHVVDCCGVIFSTTAQTYLSEILALQPEVHVGLFYTLYVIILIGYFRHNRYVFSIANFFFVLSALISLIAIFGTYIYELPTHHCPFCMLQKEYFSIGYFLYTFLFIGTFFGIVVGLLFLDKRKEKRYFLYSLIANTLYVIIVSFYPISYYIKNGVWL